MPQATVSFDPAQIAALAKILTPTQKKQAMYQTVKRTSNSIAAEAHRTAKTLTTLKPADINSKIKGRMVQEDPPAAELRVSGASIPLVNFRTRFSKSGGITATPTVGKPPIRFRQGFKAVVGGGHTGGFIRARGKGRRVVKTKNGHRYSSQLPIKQLFGPPLSAIMGSEAVLKPAIDKTADLMQKNLLSQLDRFLKK